MRLISFIPSPSPIPTPTEPYHSSPHVIPACPVGESRNPDLPASGGPNLQLTPSIFPTLHHFPLLHPQTHPPFLTPRPATAGFGFSHPSRYCGMDRAPFPLITCNKLFPFCIHIHLTLTLNITKF